nr:RNA-directed DNA polymerase, eukaryota [Tanacetum cinerariifolium]
MGSAPTEPLEDPYDIPFGSARPPLSLYQQGSDFSSVVLWFFDKGVFSKGCNSSFIALIPKVADAKFVTDFCPISLIGSVYKVVTKILANRLSLVISDLVSNSQSAFIANRQILDGPFILNEVLAWFKNKKKQALVFKADFTKAYDSVRWDFLLDVLHAFGFGPRWHNWIQAIFSSNMASLLINGSPTIEFPIHRGLKQGDLLAPLLFILVMESLHISVSRVVNDGLFKGIQISGSMHLSHLFYADDAVFLGEWSESNLDNLIRILKCFLRASGLRINVNKSQILGVGLPMDTVMQGASRIGCEKCVFNANHDASVTKFLNEVNLHDMVPSHKTTTRYKPVEQISVAKKPERQIPIGHRFSIKKTSAVHEETKTPRSCLRWKPIGRIFKTIGLRWVPTGKIFTSSITKVDTKSPHGSNIAITNPHECKQTLDLSA